MPMLKLFKTRLPSCKFIFPSGKEANFVNGEYATDDNKEIAYLNDEIKLGHPHLYIDSKQKEVDSEKRDPIEEIRRKAVEEYINSQAAAIDPTNDMGETDQSGKLEGILNTENLTTGAPSNNKSAVGARLANIKNPK